MICMLRYHTSGQGIEVVHEASVDRIMNINMLSFINTWCMQYGSTMEGRRITCAKHLGIQQKVPILISERTRDILFPTRNVREESCVWINYRFVDYIRGNAHTTTIYFVHGVSYEFAIDQRVIKRGMRLCKEYLQILASSPI